LRTAGYDVVECSTGTSALRRIEADAPDLILLDIELPDISGHSVLQVIRADPNTHLLPVAVLTSLATGAVRHRAYAEGATDFVAKPFSTTELLARVRALVTLGQSGQSRWAKEAVDALRTSLLEERDTWAGAVS
jgi:two-component system phosphate regulon response regulator PhoB